MSDLFGGSSKNGYDVTGGGTNAPWTWGVSPFDQQAIDAATAQSGAAIDARYKQLGLGGSTMEHQDEAQNELAGSAQTGQEQTSNVGSPALNPALQPQLNQLIGVNSNQGNQTAETIGNVIGAGGKLATAL